MTETAIAWFEIPVSDLDRAAGFYGSVLEANLAEMESPGGKMMAFMNGEEPVGALSTTATSSADGISVYFSSPDIDAALARAEAGGGKIVMEKTSIGPYGFVGKFTDTEGNHISLHSRA